jgi:Raf kinase inhibitor-like YbhB/YbcL family protein
MKVYKILLSFIVVVIVAIIGIRVLSGEDNWICVNGMWVMHGKPDAPKPTTACPKKLIQKEVTMKLTSPIFVDGQPIPADYSCKGEGLRPQLIISGVPKEAVSLALTMDDPDAPMGTFHHWLVWNISVGTTEIGSSIPTGSIEGTNSAGRVGYVPPCPPSGTHRYIYSLYTLNSTLNLPAASDSDTLQSAMKSHILEKVTLTGTFGN